MKNYLKLPLIALFIIFSFSSCDKDDIKILASMSCDIDGTNWTSAGRVTTLQSNVFVITGTSLAGEVIIVTINGSEEGEYKQALNPVSAGCVGVYKASTIASAEDTYSSTKGEVVLTKVDKTNKKISGSFEFTVGLTDVKQITEGKFEDLNYTGGE